MTILGPESPFATSPANTYTPAPRVLPTPRAMRSTVPRQRHSLESSRLLRSTTFLRTSDRPNDTTCSNILAPVKRRLIEPAWTNSRTFTTEIWGFHNYLVKIYTPSTSVLLKYGKKQRRMLLKYKLIDRLMSVWGTNLVCFFFCSFYNKDKQANNVEQRVCLYVTVTTVLT